MLSNNRILTQTLHASHFSFEYMSKENTFSKTLSSISLKLTS